MFHKYICYCLIATMGFLFSCQQHDTLFKTSSKRDYLTENVIIIIIDGPRYEETWGDNLRRNISLQDKLSEEGVFFRNFYNDGITYTLAGHTAITTGYKQDMRNNGTQVPDNPSILQAYLKFNQVSPEKAYFAASKQKLAALMDTKDKEWNGSFIPTYDIADRGDSSTFKAALKYLDSKNPSLSIIQFKGPDHYGHKNDRKNYIKAIKESDYFVDEIWAFIQQNEYYANKTTLLVTNDHGRHSDGVNTGFKDHGDNCEGCKHISLLALGPDFAKGKIVERVYDQTDISATVSELLDFPWASEGEIIEELVEKR